MRLCFSLRFDLLEDSAVRVFLGLASHERLSAKWVCPETGNPQVSSVGCRGHSVENAVTWLQAANTQQRCIYLIQTEKMPNLLDRAGDLIAVWQCEIASTTNLLPWTHRTVQADCMLVVAHILAWDGLGGTPIVLLGPTGRIEQEGRIPCVEGNH